MAGIERSFKDSQRSLVKRLGLGIASLWAIDFSQIVKRRRNGRTVGSIGRLPYCQRSLVKRFDVGIASLRALEHSEAAERERNIRMARTERFLTYRQRSLV